MKLSERLAHSKYLPGIIYLRTDCRKPFFLHQEAVPTYHTQPSIKYESRCSALFLALCTSRNEGFATFLFHFSMKRRESSNVPVPQTRGLMIHDLRKDRGSVNQINC
jgi:hypothetical protein